VVSFVKRIKGGKCLSPPLKSGNEAPHDRAGIFVIASRRTEMILPLQENDAVLGQRYFTHLAPDPFLLAEEVPKHHLAALGTDEVHRFQDQLITAIAPYIGFEIAHGSLLVRSR
jgi:hypothetical protein